VELRGNIETRLSKVPDGGAVVMAVAALEGLGMTELLAEVLDPAEFVPMVGQGCVAVECRDDDRDVLSALAAIDDDATRREVEIERAFLAELGSGCALPIGAHVSGTRLWTFIAGAGGISRNTVELSGDVAQDVRRARDAAARALQLVG